MPTENWMQYLDEELYAALESFAKERKMTVSKLIQYTVVPDWLRMQGLLKA